jgi:hypothetical protein
MNRRTKRISKTNPKSQSSSSGGLVRPDKPGIEHVTPERRMIRGFEANGDPAAVRRRRRGMDGEPGS